MKIKWGGIGAGGIAMRRTIPEFVTMANDSAELVAVMDVDESRARAVAEKFNVPHYCTTEDALLAQGVQAVYIATPPNVHRDQAIKAANAGVHILCEKPVAVSVAEVDEIDAAAKKNGVKFMLGFCMRNNIYNKKARELVQSGALGTIVMGRAQLTCWYPPIPGAWRQDKAVGHGGSLIDMGTHCLDLLEWIMGSKIVEVTGFQDMMVHAYHTRVEDSSTIVARFANGTHGIIDNYFNLPDAAAQNSLELHGTKGSIIGQGTIGQDPTGKMFSIIQPQETGYNADQVRDNPVSREEYHFDGIGLYGQTINIFSRCIIEDKEPPITIEDGRHSVKLVDAIYKAVEEKRVVAVD